MLSLFSDEEIVTRTDGDEITLTNYRINYSYKERGASIYISIFLEDISSVQTAFKSKFIFLVLAILSAIATLFNYYENSQRYYSRSVDSISNVFLLILTAVFLMLWFSSRKRIVEIHSNGGKPISLNTNNWSYEQAITFLENVQLAKAQRVFSLYKTNADTQHN